MKISAIRAWQVDLPLKEGRYNWSKGNFVEVFDSTVVAVETDAGLTGAPQRVDGFMTTTDAPALGITPKVDSFGPPVLEIS